jgi:hypothetical protein
VAAALVPILSEAEAEEAAAVLAVAVVVRKPQTS